MPNDPSLYYYSQTNFYLRNLLAIAAIFVISIGVIAPAYALPSFARQTGDDCTSCHVGGFGPQLTPHGIAFKLTGYTDNNDTKSLPLSGMAIGTWTHTRKGQTAAPTKNTNTNDNSSLQEVSMFLAGGLTEHLGSFIQATYSDLDRRKIQLDQADLRYAQTTQLGGKDTILGLSINNTPTMTDPFNSLASWRFPYIKSELVPGPVADPVIGGMGGQVGGITAYGLWDESIYAELGGYHTLSRGMLEATNVIAKGDALNKIDGVAPYGRIAYYQDLHKMAWHAGVFGFAPNIRLDGGPSAKDGYLDIGVDASFQYLGTRKHILAFNTSLVHEDRDLNASVAAGMADSSSGYLDRFDFSGSYYYNQTWGLTAAIFDIHGNSDHSLYGGSSRLDNPNSNGYILQADWIPFGKEGSWGAPWANVRLGLQYTGYTKLNGAKFDYDGTGRSAKDNDTLFAYLWAAF